MVKKIVIIFFLLVSSVLAGDIEDNIIEFEKKRLSHNKRMQIQEIKIIHKEDIELDGWQGYILDIKLKLQDKTANIKDIVFSNGKIIATDLHDIKTGESLKKHLQKN